MPHLALNSTSRSCTRGRRVDFVLALGWDEARVQRVLAYDGMQGGRAGSKRSSSAHDRQVGISTEGMVAEFDRHISVQTGATRTSPPLADTSVTLRLISGPTVKSVRVGDENEDPGEPALTSDWVAAWLRGPDGCRVLLLDTRRARIRAEIQLARAQRVALRLGTEFLTIGDDTGRLLLVELAQGRLVRDHRT